MSRWTIKRRRIASALAALLVVTSFLTGGPLVSSVAAAVPSGSTKYVAVTPARLADTRLGTGFTRPGPANVIRVVVAGQAGVPANATAAVLNIAGLNNPNNSYITVWPAGQPRPTASNVNLDVPNRIIANMATVKLGADGAVDIFTSSALNVVVDVSGAYVPVTGAVAEGRLVTLGAGAARVYDSRELPGRVPFAVNSTRSIDLAASGIPASASAVVVSIAATEANAGFWTAFPSGVSLPGTSTLNLDGANQTRAGQAIVQLPTSARSINVYSQTGGHIVVDVAGWFTGVSDPVSEDGLFVPTTPLRMLDTRFIRSLAPWARSSYEFNTGNGAIGVSAVAMNVTGTQPWDTGFVTAYPAGLNRPFASNLNFIGPDQTIANHAITRITSRGAALYTQNGSHLIADVAGWYTGTLQAVGGSAPANPVYNPNPATYVYGPSGGVSVGIRTGTNLNAIADAGFSATWGDLVRVATAGNMMLFGHRTSGSAPFRNIDNLPIGGQFAIQGSDGHWYTYRVTRRDVVAPNYNTIANLAKPYGPITAQLVACHPPGSVKYRIVVTGRLVSIT